MVRYGGYAYPPSLVVARGAGDAGERFGEPGVVSCVGRRDDVFPRVLSTLTRQLLIELYPGFNPHTPRGFGFDKPALVGTPNINSAVREHALVLGTLGVESVHDPPAKVALTGSAYDALVRKNEPDVVVLDRGSEIGPRALDLGRHAITAGAGRVDIISTDLTGDGFAWAIEPDI